MDRKQGIVAGVAGILLVAIVFAALAIAAANESPQTTSQTAMAGEKMSGQMNMTDNMSKMMSKDNMEIMNRHMKECQEMMGDMMGNMH